MKKSKLKRRLRKKHHLGEFQEFGFEIFANLKIKASGLEFDNFCNDFIDMIEENKLEFGGGGRYDAWEGFVCSGDKFASPSIEDREKVKRWLENRKEVGSCKVGEFIDAWNDPKWNN